MENPEQSPKWEKIYTHPDAFHVEVLKQAIEASGFQVVSLNKKDVYGLSGVVELYTLAQDAVEAKKIIHEPNHE